MTDRKIFAVAGRPVLHSLSPRLFRAAYAGRVDRPVYTRFSAASAGEALAFARETGLSGLNITAPLKADVFPLLSVFDEAAAALGAANTLVRDGDGFRGFNTDPAGVARALAKAGIDAGARRALVLGAGGAGRAAAYSLRGLGADVVLCSRVDGKAAAAAAKLGVAPGPWAARSSLLAGCDLLVSCLPPDADAVPPDWLRPGLVVLEAAYPDPPLSRAARARGCAVIPGEDWLLGQAIPAFRLFTGLPPDEAAMAAALRSGPKPFSGGALKVALVGFMGSGKTTVGRRLADKLGLSFEDSDARVVRRMGRSIPEIFRGDGEAAFRAEESRVLREILGGPGSVVCACGGGSMESEENRVLAAAGALVVWLHAPADVCRSRIDAGTRPLLAMRVKSAAAFEALFQARLSCYAEAADLAVGSDGPEELAARTIHEEIRRIVAD